MGWGGDLNSSSSGCARLFGGEGLGRRERRERLGAGRGGGRVGRREERGREGVHREGFILPIAKARAGFVVSFPRMSLVARKRKAPLSSSTPLSQVLFSLALCQSALLSEHAFARSFLSCTPLATRGPYLRET